MLQNPNFPGLRPAPDPAGEAYSAPQTPYLIGRGLAAPLPRTPLPLSALRASCLRVSGPTHYRVDNHTNDRFEI